MSVHSYAEGALRDAAGEPASWPALALFGDPVDHSLSPRLHAAALRTRGLPGEYRAVRVVPADLEAAIGDALSAGVRGLNLTVPHKESALALAAGRTDECLEIGATNTLVARNGSWMAHNTDSRGFAMALERDLGGALDRVLDHCALLGGGGAARAARVALVGLGARKIDVVVRAPERVRLPDAPGLRVRPLSAGVDPAWTLLVNCTPLGLRGDDPAPVDPAAIPERAYVFDMTYADAESALLAGFGGRKQDGRAMLVAQAALAFSVWFGALPPLTEMAAAIGLDW